MEDNRENLELLKKVIWELDRSLKSLRITSGGSKRER